MWKHTRLQILLLSLDFVAVLLALILASILRPDLPLGQPIGKMILWPLPFWVAIPIIWILSLYNTSSYNLKACLQLADELRNLFSGSILAALVISGLTFFSYRELSRLQVILFAVLATTFLFLFRLILRLLLKRWGIRPFISRRVILVGINDEALKVAHQIEEHSWMGLQLVGFLGDSYASNLPKPCLGPIDDTIGIVLENNIDEVVITLPPQAHKRVRTIVHRLQEKTSVNVRMVPSVFPLSFLRIKVEEFGSMPLITLREPVPSPLQRFAKRSFDIAVSLGLVILLSPLMTILALLIKFSSRGPVIFKQERVGEGKHLFWMYKFRTMVKDAEKQQKDVIKHDENGRLIHKMPDDPRITRIGRIIRHLSLDELPQLFNVLKGEMSLVGPRPELPWLVEKYEGWQHKRFSVPQGITGWWQVSGRSERPMHLSTEDDLFYIQNFSLWFDIVILWKTIRAVVKGRGAF